MECERLQRLVKRWYLQVQAEEMGPARMVDFMNNHVSDCMACMADPGVEFELKRITEIVLPQDKIPKAVRKEAETQSNSVPVGADAPAADNDVADNDVADNDVADDDSVSDTDDELDDADDEPDVVADGAIVDGDDELHDAEI